MIELCCECLSAQRIWLYVIIMSRTSFRVNSHSIIYLNVKELLTWSRHHIWSLSDSNAIRTHNHITIECGFTLKLVRDMITCSQMQRTDKNSWHSSIVWPVQLNGWVFVYKVNGCAFKSRCCHLNFSYGTCFEQGVPWHSGKL